MQALELAAQYRNDPLDPTPLETVRKLLSDKAVLKDIHALELYQWIYMDSDSRNRYSETFGELRLRLVQALPKDYDSAFKCFTDCVRNGDWKHAQQVSQPPCPILPFAKLTPVQIAVLMDKNTQKPQNHFRSILTTYMYSVSCLAG